MSEAKSTAATRTDAQATDAKTTGAKGAGTRGTDAKATIGGHYELDHKSRQAWLTEEGLHKVYLELGECFSRLHLPSKPFVFDEIQINLGKKRKKQCCVPVLGYYPRQSVLRKTPWLQLLVRRPRDNEEASSK